jgi:hypothetical protein
VIDQLEMGFKESYIKGRILNKRHSFAGDTLAVNISLFQLNNKVDINSVDLSGISAYIKKQQRNFLILTTL